MSEEVKRDSSGKFVKGVSGNPLGRSKGTKGVKHRASKAKLENLLNKFGPEAIQQIMEIGQKALSQGDIGTALKTFVWIGDKYYQLTIANDRIEIQEQKRQQDKEDAERDDESVELPQVSFSFTPVVVNE